MNEIIERELLGNQQHTLEIDIQKSFSLISEIYKWNDFNVILQRSFPQNPFISELQTLDELMENDKQREKDGFPKKIRLGKLVKPVSGGKGQVIVVPTTEEPKFYHDNSITEDNEESTGGSGDGEEGEVIGEQPAQPQEGEGEGQGAGQGEGGEHNIISDAFDLGKIITERFQLPNLKDKGKKYSIVKYQFDLTDKHRGFGQILDKKATMKRIIETNILLNNISYEQNFDFENLIINPQDHVYKILSKEKDFETQAVVFFLRDYSGSMQGKPTEVVTSQHLLIYSWLMFQYQKNVVTRFILHDTEAKEVSDFYTYYKYQTAGGTNIYPAFELVNKIVEEESLAKDNNIYIFHGTDGDDWEDDGEKTIAAIRKMFTFANRVGITVAKNDWTQSTTVVEKYLEKSGLLKERPDILRLDAFPSRDSTEDRVIEGIKKLVS